MSFACCLGTGQVLSNVLSGLPSNNNMQLPIDFSTLANAVTKLPQVQIARVISGALLIYIAYVLAQITWQIVSNSPHQTGYSKVISSEGGSNKSRINIDKLLALNLFGKTSAKPVEQDFAIKDVPETKLKLVLSGVVASSTQDTAAAVIEHNGLQETYGIGDKITGTRATLRQVHADRVIIEQSGRKETLMLDGFDFNKPASRQFTQSTKTIPNNNPNSPRTNVVDQRDNIVLSKQAKIFKEDIAKDPGNITSYLTIAPKRTSGQLVGFHLRPGRDKAFFSASGLKRGDVAIQMNGLDLTDTSQVQQALELLKVEQEISLLVERNGELTEILFSIESE